MNLAPVSPAAVAPRESGWWQPVVAALLFLIVPATPFFRLVLPVDQTLMLLAPALAACAVVGWLAGGRLALALIWAALAGWAVWQLASGHGTFGLLSAGWALMLAATFGMWALVGIGRPFLSRALATIGLTLVLAGGTALAVPQGASAAVAAVGTEVGRRTEQSVAGWKQMTGSKEWRDFAADNPEAAKFASQVEEQLQVLPEAATTLFPAMLALESLAALALAWAIYHRVGRVRVGPPLSALREFRFSDQMVWALIAGLAMVVVPGFSALRGIGANLLVFFGALYAFRGLGVLIWFLAPGRLVMALLIGFAVLFWHVLGVLALGLGVGDTWLDWRNRARPKT